MTNEKPIDQREFTNEEKFYILIEKIISGENENSKDIAKSVIDYFTWFMKEYVSAPFYDLIIEERELRYIIQCVDVYGQRTNNRLDQLETLSSLYNTLVSRIGDN